MHVSIARNFGAVRLRKPLESIHVGATLVARIIVFQRIIGPVLLGVTPDEAAVAGAVPDAELCLRELNRLLGNQPFMAGNQLSLGRTGKAVMAALSDQGFSENQKSGVLSEGFDNIAIEEGSRVEVRGTILNRSRILHRMAVAHFSDVNGSISCRGCGFIAEGVYGAGARGLIEIHHLKSRKSRTVSVGIESSSLRHSAASSTGVLPVFTTCFGPRTAEAGFAGTTWPVMSQSNSMRTAASFCLTPDEWFFWSVSMYLATS